MDSAPIELGEKNSKGDTLVGSVGNFDKSEMKKRKMIRIIIVISAILLIAIIVLVLYFCLRSNGDSCDKGENDKCLTCDGKKCRSCNPFFRLENGKCRFIYSFESIYNISPSNDIEKNTKLFNDENLKDFKVNKIQVENILKILQIIINS